MFFNKRIVFSVIIIVLFSGNVLLASQCYILSKSLQANNVLLLASARNEKILNFTKLFIKKVLKAETEITFEDRLQLENAVRDIGNKDISGQWQKFVDSKGEAQAQTEVKNLLETLVNNI